MTAIYRRIGGAAEHGIVLVSDHASNRVPEGTDLGIAPELLDEHIAIDIGVAGVAEELAARHGIPAHLADISRLVVDLHREEDHPGLIPASSDGHDVPGNAAPDRPDRIARFHRPYHDAMAQWLDAMAPRLIVSLHSFTPALASDPGAPRPWDVGLLYNRKGEPARIAIDLFAQMGLTVGDNEPYSGRQLNATMNRHAEALDRDYLAIEVRNDHIRDAAGQALWADRIARVANGVVSARR